MSGAYYESDRALAEYLLFHYGAPEDTLPPGLDIPGASNFPARCVRECCDASRLGSSARALDLGCAVGRASFELARLCSEVVGIDYSERFVKVADHLRQNGAFLSGCIEEGDLTHPCQAVVPGDIDRKRVRFQRGDAMDLPADLGTFDIVLVSNLIDRLRDPRRGLEQLSRLLKPGGQLIVTSPYTWLLEYTPRESWLGGFEQGGHRIGTLSSLKQILAPHFQFLKNHDLPFLIREHARKFQFCIAEASIWIRR